MGTLVMALARMTPLLLAVFAAPFLVAGQGCTDCFESGRVVGTILTTVVQDTDCDCQVSCNSVNGCTDFTFDTTTGICSLMLSRDGLSTCSTCTSGPVSCPTVTTTTASPPACEKCYDTGRCSGTLLSTDITNTDCECQASCAANQACTDFTFDSTNGICSLMGSCTSLSTCSTCSSGPPVCPTTPPPACEKCYDTGRCTGTLLATDIADTDCECQASCASNQACTDFTFDSSNGICSLMSSCGSLSTCSTCSSGPAVCPTNSPPACEKCYDTGRCVGSLISTIITNSDCDCQSQCFGTPSCTDFTWDSANGICSLMSSCTSLSSCSACTSGPRECSSAPGPGDCGDCYEQGTCQGTVVAVDLAEDLCGCVGMCKNTTDCEFMTFTTSNSICTMTRDCPVVDTTCPDCQTGPKECPPDTACPDCSKEGQCQGTIVNVDIAEDICECKASCQNSTGGCEFISFDNSTKICTETSTCPTVDSSCSDCRWMPKVCGNEGCGDCIEQGTCFGDVVTVDFHDSVCDCKRDCENLSGCNFWTFDEADEICTLMSNCDGGTGDSCLTCSWGPKECPAEGNYHSHFLHMF